MTNGIIKTEDGFSVKDFDEDRVVFSIGNPGFPSYMDAVEACRGKFYPPHITRTWQRPVNWTRLRMQMCGRT